MVVENQENIQTKIIIQTEEVTIRNIHTYMYLSIYIYISTYIHIATSKNKKSPNLKRGQMFEESKVGHLKRARWEIWECFEEEKEIDCCFNYSNLKTKLKKKTTLLYHSFFQLLADKERGCTSCDSNLCFQRNV